VCHLLPILGFNVYVILTILTNHFGNTGRGFVRGEITAALLISHVILVFYAFKSMGVLRKFTAEIKNIFSSIEKINLSWLRFVLFGYGLLWLVIIVSSLWGIVLGSRIPYAGDFITLTTFVVSITIIYFGLTQPGLFSREEEKPKYLKSTLTEKDARGYTQKLLDYMETEKPYLTPSLTINHLSGELGIHPKHISQIINENFNQNFFDFINSYRVEEAKRHLLKGDRSNMNILQILFEVGFNSKAAFNRAFKKYVGMTPREFKNHSRQSA
jgi:AraC-like DNA-binding protein